MLATKKKYKVEAIKNSIVYTREIKDQLLGLYNLIF